MTILTAICALLVAEGMQTWASRKRKFDKIVRSQMKQSHNDISAAVMLLGLCFTHLYNAD